MSDDFLTLEEAAKELGVSMQSMYQYMSAEGHPKFPNAVKPLGQKWSIPRSDIDNLRGIKPVNPDKENAVKDINLEIEMTKKQQELDAIKLHFPTIDAYRKAQAKLVADMEAIDKDRAQIELDRKQNAITKDQNKVDREKVLNAFAIVKERENGLEGKLVKIEGEQRELNKLLSEYKTVILPIVVLLRNGLKCLDAVIYYMRYYSRYKPGELFVNMNPLRTRIYQVADKLEAYIDHLALKQPGQDS